MGDTPVLLEVDNLKKYFPVSRGFLGRNKAFLKAVDGINFDIEEGKTYGLVGLSASTTSLDATIQAQYLRLLRDLQQETGCAIIFITHDFGIVAKMCDRVAVMYAGRIVEQGDVRQNA